MNNEEKNQNNEPQKANSDQDKRQTPSLGPVLLSLIVLLLMGLSLAIGVAAGPMISDWLSGSNQPAGDGSMDGHVHGAAGGAGSQAVAEDHSEHGDSVKTPGGWYVCPMHPWVVQPEPGTCPICTMDLTPLDPERFSGEVVIDPVVLQNIGVRLGDVTVGSIDEDIRTVGTIEYDETRVSDISLKISGWVENVYVDFEGAPVRKGQKLLDIYAPELYAAQEEYLLLHNRIEVPGNVELLDAARRKLELLDITDEQIAELEANGAVQRTVSVFAPRGGYVLEKQVNPGQKVMPGTVVYRIADLSRVWLQATVYENQLPRLEVNRDVLVTMPYLPGRTFTGRIDYIYPTVDPRTREVQVRMTISNRDGALKPGMFADVRIAGPTGDQALTVLAPREAVIDTGERTVAFVSLGEGRFEPRDVRIGRHAGGRQVEILEGLAPGEKVVTSGQFLLDSESRIRESLAKMIQGEMASRQVPEAEFTGAGPSVAITSIAAGHLSRGIQAYLEIGDRLYGNSAESVAGNAGEIVSALEELGNTPVAEDEHYWHSSTAFETAKEYAVKLAAGPPLEEARVQFGYLGHALNTLIEQVGLPDELAGEVIGLRCGMFDAAPEKGVWLQRDGQAQNPFYGSGSGMAACNSERWGLPVVGGKDTQQQSQPEMAAREAAGSGATTMDQGEQPTTSQEVAMAPWMDAGTFSQFMEHWLAVHEALYADGTAGTAEHAAAMLEQIDGVQGIDTLRTGLQRLAVAGSLSEARVAFGVAGKALVEILRREGLPDGYQGRLVAKKCGMYPDAPDGGLWIQLGEETRNPFFGQEHGMAACAPEQWVLEHK